MTKVAILSDTHNRLRPQVCDRLSQVDIILHAGDLTNDLVLEELRHYATTYAVRGNNDFFGDDDLPYSRTVTIEGVTFYMVHDRFDVPRPRPEADVILYGHSHKYAQETFDNQLWLNPGSCGQKRFGGDLSMCMMTIEHGTYEIEVVEVEG